MADPRLPSLRSRNSARWRKSTGPELLLWPMADAALTLENWAPCRVEREKAEQKKEEEKAKLEKKLEKAPDGPKALSRVATTGCIASCSTRTCAGVMWHQCPGGNRAH